MRKKFALEPKEKFNIGYILPDFQQKPQICVPYPLLKLFDQDVFRVFCYTQGITAQLKDWLMDRPIQWRDFRDGNAEFLQQQVKADKLDFLIDMSGHETQACRMVLRNKSATIQLSMLGSFQSTNIKEVEYFLTDRYCTPEDLPQDYFVESPAYISSMFYCYTPWRDLPVNDAPFLKNGYLTFGCFHNFEKLTDKFLEIWRDILERVPNSKLLLKSRIFGSGFGCSETRYRLKRLGYDVDRVELRSHKSDDFIDYRDVDIMLDTFPYQGVQTTCDALYMGVPVMVFTGDKHSMRRGYSVMMNIGLKECIGDSIGSYIDKTVQLAENPYKLQNLHKSIRGFMEKSPLLDGVRYVQNVERLYLQLWNSKIMHRQHHKMLVEVENLLSTVEEGMVYLHGRLVTGTISDVVLQIFKDAMYAFDQARAVFAQLGIADVSVIDAVIADCTEVEQLCQKKQMLKAAEGIASKIMPQIKKIRQLLKNKKIST